MLRNYKSTRPVKARSHRLRSGVVRSSSRISVNVITKCNESDYEVHTYVHGYVRPCR